MSATPRTDAAEKSHRFLAGPNLPEGCLDKPFADFARELERETVELKRVLNDALAKIDAYQEMWVEEHI